MKSNLKGGNAVVRLLLAHGEKIGIAAILLCAGLLIYSALNVPRLEATKTPDKLRTDANNAKKKIEDFTYDDIAQIEQESSVPPEESKLVKPIYIDVTGMKPIEATSFPPIEPMNPHVVPPMSLRTDPVLLAPIELEVHGDAGLWASADPAQIKQRQLAALKEAQKEKAAADEERRRSDDEGAEGRGRSGRRGRDEERPEERERGRNATIVMQPHMGIELSGFETITPRSWVTVLAEVPYKSQVKIYEEALEKARGYEPIRDMPKYIGYVVERAEVTPEGQGEWKRIAQMFDKKLIEEISTYPVNPPEVVASRFVHPLLTHPLPPLILKEWDDRVSHSSMPLAVDDIPPAEQEMLDAEKAASEEGAKEGEATDDGGFGGARREAPVGGEMYGERGGGYGGEYGGRGGEYGRGGYGGEYGRGGGYGGEYGGRGGGYGGEYGGRGGGGYAGGYGRGGYGLGQGAGVELAEFTWDGKTENVLLRFFDNTVEPGHSYRYRVQLAVKDVNDNVAISALDPSVNQRRDGLKDNMRYFRLTDWSKPSPIASVPLPARTYVMKAEPGKGQVDMLIKALNSQFAAEIALEESFTRGMVMNVRNKAKVVWSNQYEEEKDPEFDFYTGVTVADIQGGDERSSKNRDLTAPARVMLMDAAGKLMIRNELQDQLPVKEFKQALEAPREGEMGGRGGYGGEGRGGRGGRGR
jgi:hypothetical protein